MTRPKPKLFSEYCQVCKHVERVHGEMLILGGASCVAVARKLGGAASEFAWRRHMRNHIDPERRASLLIGPVERAALAARVAEESASVIDHHRIVRAGLLQLFSAALAAGDRNSGAYIASGLTAVNNAIARITGELATSPLVQINNTQTNITATLAESPEFAAFWDRLVGVLVGFDNFPAIRDAMLAVLDQQSPQPVALSAPAGRTLEHLPDDAAS